MQLLSLLAGALLESEEQSSSDEVCSKSDLAAAVEHTLSGNIAKVA